MTATSNVSTRAIPEVKTSVHPLNIIVVFCALVLGASFCLATYGLDLSAGFFSRAVMTCPHTLAID
jgi:hypothetical protein